MSDDPATILRVRLSSMPPGQAAYWLCRVSLARRLVEDSAGSGDEAADLGPLALPMLTQSADRGEFTRAEMMLVGVAYEPGGRWLAWMPPAPREPVPGSPGQAGARN